MKFKLPELRIDFNHLAEKLRENSRLLILSSITILGITILSCLVVFVISLKGSEQVMVPDIGGKDLTVAMLELQAKELYPKIQLRYSESNQDKGIVLEQNPSPGTIVKAGRRINLVISRGVIIDRIENYIGQNIDDVKIHLQTLFTSMTVPLIAIQDPPLFQFSALSAGTILEQDPPPDTAITGPVQLKVVISRGPENDRVTVPSLIGLSIPETLVKMGQTPILFDFTARDPDWKEEAGTVVSQMPAENSQVASFSRVSAVIALPVTPTDGNIYGIFTETLPTYPYPFQIRLDKVTPKGERSEMVTLKHPGGSLTIPYAVPEGTLLVLTILNKEVITMEVRALEAEATE